MSTAPNDDSRQRRQSHDGGTRTGPRDNWDYWLNREWIGPRARSKARQRGYDPRKPSREVPRSAPRAHLRGWLLQRSYYAALNADNEFRADLRQLDRDVADADGTARARLIGEFARKWRLPRRLRVRDIEWSLTSQDQRRGLRLLVAPRMTAAKTELRLPFKQRSPEYLEEVGRDMFRWNFREMTWDALGEADHTDASAVRKRVTHAARLFDVPLREGTPGRPRRKLGK